MNVKKVIFAALFVGLAVSSLQARGRRPDNDDDKDTFPDYNRLEMHPKPKESQTPAPENAPTPTLPPARPSLNTPANPLPSDEETSPKPPPKAVPLPDNASEPPMPDDLINAPTPSTTGQNPTPAK